MKITFVSDYVCPYCLVAKEAMLRALASTRTPAEIVWHPFELTEEPKPQVDTYHDEVRKSHYQVLVEPCEKLSLSMKLPPNIVPRPYTRLAFEGYFFAREHGAGDTYNSFVYQAYFIDEKNIGNLDILCELAANSGLDVAAFRLALENGTYSAQEKEAVRYAKEVLKISHVPTIYIDDTEVDVNSYTVEEFVSILQNQKQTTAANRSGMCCGPDGCGF